MHPLSLNNLEQEKEVDQEALAVGAGNEHRRGRGRGRGRGQGEQNVVIDGVGSSRENVISGGQG